MFLLLFERMLHRIDMKINGEHIQDTIMTVCIGSARGYGLTPSAVPYNGWLDVSVVYRPELLQLIKGLWLLVNGRLLNLKVVKPYRTHKVKINRVQNAAISLDGRQLYYDESSLDVRILPEALTLIIPK
jgi:diacylglycerol kinase family enzyme